jgi:rsbT co-antagonist protein RsbR
MKTEEQTIGGLLVLRDVYGRSLFERYLANPPRLSAALDVYEPVTNRILSIVAMTFIDEREKVVRKQQEAIRELSTPVLQVRERLLIMPIIGVLDSARAKQLTENLLRSIRANRAKVVVIDITGVPAVDSKVANHLVQTVDAARLLGATAIVTGLSPEIAQTLVTIGVDLSRMATVGDLQGGIDQADRLLGYRVITGEQGAVTQG